MKSVVKNLFILLTVIFFAAESFAAANDITPATHNAYQITIKRLRLYEPGKAAWVTAGEGDLLVDIASPDAGEDITDYIKWSAVPEGNYTRVEVTLDRDIRIQAPAVNIQASTGLSAPVRHIEEISKVPSTISGVDVAADTYTRIFNLPTTLPVKKGLSPSVKVKFDITGTATFREEGNSKIVIYPGEPLITIEIL